MQVDAGDLAFQDPNRLHLLAIGPQLASRVPIQLDEDDESGGALGSAWGSPWAPLALLKPRGVLRPLRPTLHVRPL